MNNIISEHTVKSSYRMLYIMYIIPNLKSKYWDVCRGLKKFINQPYQPDYEDKWLLLPGRVHSYKLTNYSKILYKVSHL